MTTELTVFVLLSALLLWAWIEDGHAEPEEEEDIFDHLMKQMEELSDEEMERLARLLGDTGVTAEQAARSLSAMAKAINGGEDG